ncbi:MAG: universal stress protein [Mailhella sp.]|nr:universal stress protein [Mailhella sp.]
MIKKILLAVDGSELSEKAVNTVCELASKGSYNIILLNVLDPVSCLINGETRDEVKKELSAKGMEILKKYQKQIEAMNLECTLKQAFGMPSTQILYVAHEENVDMIAMGCHGKSSFAEIFLGSVSQHVLERFNGAVLLIR